MAIKKETKPTQRWTVVLEKDPETGAVFLPLDDNFLKQEDWRTGDHIRFEDVKLGSMKLVNVSKQARKKLAGDTV